MIKLFFGVCIVSSFKSFGKSNNFSASEIFHGFHQPSSNKIEITKRFFLEPCIVLAIARLRNGWGLTDRKGGLLLFLSPLEGPFLGLAILWPQMTPGPNTPHHNIPHTHTPPHTPPPESTPIRNWSPQIPARPKPANPHTPPTHTHETHTHPHTPNTHPPKHPKNTRRPS